MTTLITKTTPLFCHEWQRVRVSSRHLVSTRRVSISIILIIESNSIIIILSIARAITLICIGHMKGSHDVTAHLSLASCNMAYRGVHLTQLITHTTYPWNYASLRLTVAAWMAHITWKWSKMGMGTEKWHKILVIAELKMSLSWNAISLETFMIERMKWERKTIVRCFNKERKNRAQGLVIEL